MKLSPNATAVIVAMNLLIVGCATPEDVATLPTGVVKTPSLRADNVRYRGYNFPKTIGKYYLPDCSAENETSLTAQGINPTLVPMPDLSSPTSAGDLNLWTYTGKIPYLMSGLHARVDPPPTETFCGRNDPSVADAIVVEFMLFSSPDAAKVNLAKNTQVTDEMKGLGLRLEVKQVGQSQCINPGAHAVCYYVRDATQYATYIPEQYQGDPNQLYEGWRDPTTEQLAAAAVAVAAAQD